MAMICPKCKHQYDVTLFEFGNAVECDCGARIKLNPEKGVIELKSEGKHATSSFSLIAGKKEKMSDKHQDVLCIGDCTRKMGKGVFVEGCPPKKSKIKEVFARFFSCV